MHMQYFLGYTMLGHKPFLNIFKNIEIIESMFYDHSDMKVEINSRQKVENMWKLNNIVLKQWVK